MSKWQTSEVTTPAHLDELIEEATVDCYDEEEQATGFFTIIEDNLALPFTTRILGVDASVAAIAMDDDGRIKAVCERNGELQPIDLIDLPLPSPPPSGSEWIAAYRRGWREAGSRRMRKKTRTNRTDPCPIEPFFRVMAGLDARPRQPARNFQAGRRDLSRAFAEVARALAALLYSVASLRRQASTCRLHLASVRAPPPPAFRACLPLELCSQANMPNKLFRECGKSVTNCRNSGARGPVVS